MESIEIEFKNLLKETDYQRLLTEFHFSEEDFLIQENCYFDSESWLLKQRKMGLRIRLFSTSAELTLKTPLIDGLLETTDQLTKEQAQIIITKNQLPSTGAVAEKIKSLEIPLAQLKMIGSLKTKRAEKQLQKGILLVLDESWYHNHHDYELEMEVADATLGKQFFDNFLAERTIPIQPAPNKITRMVAALNKK